MDSILTSIKKLLGIVEEDTSFDADIIMHINSVFSTLLQLGVGPSAGFVIEDDSAEWYDFIEEQKPLSFVKIYVYLKVKMVFDPPSNSSVIEAYDRQISELEFRILNAVECPISSN